MEPSAKSPAESRVFPSRDEFDEEAYVQRHVDVAAAIADGIVGSGWQHFTLHGFAEGRQWYSRLDPFFGVSREIAPGDGMCRENETHYFDVGESALHAVETALFAARRRKSSVTRILDLPCGHGRVLRFLRNAFPGAQLTACDLDRDGIEFCASRFGAEPVRSRVDPDEIPLHGPFDLIWCGSLLTHLPLERCTAFLRVFERELAPGGILVFTLHGRRCEEELVSGKNRCGLDDSRIAALLDGHRRTGFGYVDYADEPGYGISLASPAFVTANFVLQPGWRLLGYHEAGWDQRQDVIAVQRVRLGRDRAD